LAFTTTTGSEIILPRTIAYISQSYAFHSFAKGVPIVFPPCGDATCVARSLTPIALSLSLYKATGDRHNLCPSRLRIRIRWTGQPTGFVVRGFGGGLLLRYLIQRFLMPTLLMLIDEQRYQDILHVRHHMTETAAWRFSSLRYQVSP